MKEKQFKLLASNWFHWKNMKNKTQGRKKWEVKNTKRRERKQKETRKKKIYR